MNLHSLTDWLRPPKTRAIIADIDDTICTCFDWPIAAALQVLRAIDPAIVVHYVTARPEASRKGTERFLVDHRLPGWRNLHFCPEWQSPRLHKAEVIARLAKQYRVIVSVGDHGDEELASRAARVPFVRVSDEAMEEAWREVERLVNAAVVEKSPDQS
jgi:hypothetical protein